MEEKLLCWTSDVLSRDARKCWFAFSSSLLRVSTCLHLRQKYTFVLIRPYTSLIHCREYICSRCPSKCCGFTFFRNCLFRTSFPLLKVMNLFLSLQNFTSSMLWIGWIGVNSQIMETTLCKELWFANHEVLRTTKRRITASATVLPSSLRW